MKDVPLAVEVPVAERDKPAWVKVGVIAAVGFVIGIAWPRVFGVRLGPSAPGEAAAAAAAAASASGHGGRAPEAPPASVVAKLGQGTPVAPTSAAAAPVAAPAATGGGGAPTITVQKGTVISCKTADGETKKGAKECGGVPGIDLLVHPRVRKIATCSGVEGQTGKLALIVNADFGSGRFWYDIGKSSTVTNIDAVTACLKTAFHGTSATATAHEHPRYTVAYNAIFAAPADDDRVARKGEKADKGEKPEKAERAAKEAPPDEKPADSPTPPATPGTGEAQVAWEVALVRDAPKTGALLSRLPRGSRVKVGAPKDGWYQIKFGDGFANEGWVYRGAIGR